MPVPQAAPQPEWPAFLFGSWCVSFLPAREVTVSDCYLPLWQAPTATSWRGLRGPHCGSAWDTGRGNPGSGKRRSEEHTSELQSRLHLVCRLLLEKKKQTDPSHHL